MTNLLWFFCRERRDERRASRLRADFGHRGWIVSWRRGRIAGRWVARLSCSSFPETVERQGKSRRQAIERAAAAMGELLCET